VEAADTERYNNALLRAIEGQILPDHVTLDDLRGIVFELGSGPINFRIH